MHSRHGAGSLTDEPIDPKHLSAAAAFADRHELGLRAGDALHIAIAATLGHALATLDAKMTKAAQVLGVPVEALD